MLPVGSLENNGQHSVSALSSATVIVPTTVTGSVTETYNSSKSESVSSDVSESYGGDQITRTSGDVEIYGSEIHLNKE